MDVSGLPIACRLLVWALKASCQTLLSIYCMPLILLDHIEKWKYSNIALEYVWWAILHWSQCLLELFRLYLHVVLESWESMSCASNHTITVSVLFNHQISVLHSCPLIWINLCPKGEPVAHGTFCLNKGMFADLRRTPCMDTLVLSVWTI